MAEGLSMSAEESEWISPQDAVEQIEQHVGGRQFAKTLIADLLRDGRVVAKAARIWDSSAATLDDAWSGRKKSDLETDAIIDSSIWRDSKYWDLDLSLWQWPENRFVITRQKKPADRTMIEDMAFRSAHVRAIMKSGTDTAPQGRGGGRPRDTERWTNFWLSIVQLAVDRRLNITSLPTKAEFRRIVIDEMGSGAFSEDAIKRPIRQVWNRFVDPKDTSDD